MAEIKVNEINYKNFGKCIQLSNGIADLVITKQLGPRIIRYGFIGSHNQFCDDASLTVDVGDDKWHLYGGHRLWHSPETFPRTYMPDNEEVQIKQIDGGISVIAKDKSYVQVDKQIDIKLSDKDSSVNIVHTLTNSNAWQIHTAAWALSVMAEGGLEIVPVCQKQSHSSEGFKNARTVILWSYTKMNDKRIFWGDKYITLKQDKNIKQNLKFGISNTDGWAAYINRNQLFVKKYNHHSNAIYPDGGVSYETFTCDFMLEMESLSPLVLLEPQDKITHEENWMLFDNVSLGIPDEKHIDEIVLKYIK